MSKRKPPKNLRPYATPSGKKARMVEVPANEVCRMLDEGGLSVPHLTLDKGHAWAEAAQLAKWRAFQTTSGEQQ